MQIALMKHAPPPIKQMKVKIKRSFFGVWKSQSIAQTEPKNTKTCNMNNRNLTKTCKNLW